MIGRIISIRRTPNFHVNRGTKFRLGFLAACVLAYVILPQETENVVLASTLALVFAVGATWIEHVKTTFKVKVEDELGSIHVYVLQTNPFRLGEKVKLTQFSPTEYYIAKE